MDLNMPEHLLRPFKYRRATTKKEYSLTSENLTQIKRYTAQILSYKIFSFCEQTLKIGANDASG